MKIASMDPSRIAEFFPQITGEETKGIEKASKKLLGPSSENYLKQINFPEKNESGNGYGKP